MTAPSSTHLFLLLRNFNVFVDCSKLIPTIEASHKPLQDRPVPKLTKRIIDAVEPQATEFFLWDEGIPGFGLRVMPAGRTALWCSFAPGDVRAG
jgi:hypothetical protein